MRQRGLSEAIQRGLRIGGKAALITGAVAAAGYGVVRGTTFAIDRRERKTFLATVAAAKLPDDFVTALVADLSEEISRVVNESVAPLLKLVT